MEEIVIEPGDGRKFVLPEDMEFSVTGGSYAAQQTGPREYLIVNPNLSPRKVLTVRFVPSKG